MEDDSHIYSVRITAAAVRQWVKSIEHPVWHIVRGFGARKWVGSWHFFVLSVCGQRQMMPETSLFVGLMPPQGATMCKSCAKKLAVLSENPEGWE